MKLFDDVKKKITDTVNDFKDGEYDDDIEKLKKSASDTVDKTKDMLEDIGEQAGDVFENAKVGASLAVDKAKDVIEDVYENREETFEKVKDTTGKAMKSAGVAVGSLIDGATKVVKDVVEDLKDKDKNTLIIDGTVVDNDIEMIEGPTAEEQITDAAIPEALTIDEDGEVVIAETKDTQTSELPDSTIHEEIDAVINGSTETKDKR